MGKPTHNPARLIYGDFHPNPDESRRLEPPDYWTMGPWFETATAGSRQSISGDAKVIQVPEVPISQEQVIEQRLVGCGLEPKGISVKYEEDLQSIEVIIRPAARADKGHFECIKDAVAHEIVTFEDDAMYTAYNEFTSEAARPEMIASLTARLQKSGLLQGFPMRGDFPSLGEYARALEKHAGTKPGAALRVDGDSIVFDPPQDANLPGEFAAKYSELLSVVMFASVRDRISFGFIGNEAVGSDP